MILGKNKISELADQIRKDFINLKNFNRHYKKYVSNIIFIYLNFDIYININILRF